ncbi:MAG: hypothetical protein WCS65_00540 [Verrucomicrobiae bacterium]
MFNALKRLFVYLGLMMEKSTETQAIDEAVIERGIRDQRAKADAANTANGQMKTQMILLKEQIRNEERQVAEYTAQLKLAAQTNDELNGAHFAELLDNVQQEILRNKEQMEQYDVVYKNNVQIIANSLKEIERYQREFEMMKARVKTSEAQKGLAELVKNSIQELQGMSEVGQAMGRMKERAAGGEGQMAATIDLANAMGKNVAADQSARNARGRALFEQFKQSGTLTNPEVAAESKPAERQKIAE